MDERSGGRCDRTRMMKPNNRVAGCVGPAYTKQLLNQDSGFVTALCSGNVAYSYVLLYDYIRIYECETAAW
jgi:hypothetical protein